MQHYGRQKSANVLSVKKEKQTKKKRKRITEGLEKLMLVLNSKFKYKLETCDVVKYTETSTIFDFINNIFLK